MTTIEKARAAIMALREPDVTFASVPNTVRQSIADTIEALITPVGEGREICECEKCGRSHWRLASRAMERSTGNRKYLREEDCEDNDEGA